MKTRRRFLETCAAGAASLSLQARWPSPARDENQKKDVTLPFRISLAQWSLHRTLFSRKLDHLDFARHTQQQFGIDAVEYVNQFFMDKARDLAYLGEMKKRAEDAGVTSLLIMCDGEGQLGHPDQASREKAVSNHHKWVEAAKFLGCHSIRVNAASRGTFEETQKLAAAGLRRLTEFAAPYSISVLVENHGGLSSNGAWLASVMKLVDHEGCGTLPDFGNFHIGGGKRYDRYKGVAELMPFAKAVSAKSHKFDDHGNDMTTDFFKMMKIVLEAGYSGHVGIEWEGNQPSEYQGILLTKNLLERVRRAPG